MQLQSTAHYTKHPAGEQVWAGGKCTPDPDQQRARQVPAASIPGNIQKWLGKVLRTCATQAAQLGIDPAR
jgi:hypothetical protein